jgi:hypothetical protein
MLRMNNNFNTYDNDTNNWEPQAVLPAKGHNNIFFISHFFPFSEQFMLHVNFLKNLVSKQYVRCVYGI